MTIGDKYNGQKFQQLTILGFSHSKNNSHYYSCKCSCGNIKSYQISRVINNQVKSCGCAKTLAGKKHELQLKGLKFNRLTVLGFSHKLPDGKTVWFYVCECGNFGSAVGKYLNSGKLQSCGCIQREKAEKHLRQNLHPNQKGSSNPNYKPYLTEEDRLSGRNIPGYANWSKSVKERDNFTCQVCGDKLSTMVSHHIEAYHLRKDLRMELSNGITLCENCHRTYHKFCGLKNINRKTFEEWKNGND